MVNLLFCVDETLVWFVDIDMFGITSWRFIEKAYIKSCYDYKGISEEEYLELMMDQGLSLYQNLFDYKQLKLFSYQDKWKFANATHKAINNVMYAKKWESSYKKPTS